MAAALFLAVISCSSPEPGSQPASGFPEEAPRVEPPEGGGAPQPGADADVPEPASSVPEDRLIRADGIGHVRPGMTIGELRAALPPDHRLGMPGPFMVDVAGIPVVAGNDTLYHVLVPAGAPSGESARIELVATTNPAFKTAEGLGPGTTLGEAAAMYGGVTLSYSVEDESREYARFPGLPPSIRVRVAPPPAGGPFAGIYEPGVSPPATTRYDSSARVAMVMVALLF